MPPPCCFLCCSSGPIAVWMGTTRLRLRTTRLHCHAHASRAPWCTWCSLQALSHAYHMPAHASLAACVPSALLLACCLLHLASLLAASCLLHLACLLHVPLAPYCHLAAGTVACPVLRYRTPVLSCMPRPSPILRGLLACLLACLLAYLDV